MAVPGFPKQLEEIAEVIGLPNALKLADAKGGQRITIPGNVKEGHWLSELLGFENAQKLCHLFTNGCGIQIEMPSGLYSSAHRRNNEIYARLDAGESANHIAEQMGLSRRWILDRKANAALAAPAKRLPDLFDE